MPKNPRRVAAGRRNRKLRGPLSSEARERLRQAALVNRPWEKSTGPKTPEGIARCTSNLGGHTRKKGNHTIRELRELTAAASEMSEQMMQLRAQAMRLIAAGKQ